MPEATYSRNYSAMAVAAFLAGVGIGACAKPGLGAVGFLVSVTGLGLVAAFRLYEGRAVAQEDRIASLEEHRRAVERQNDRLEAISDSIAKALATLASGESGTAGFNTRTPALARLIGNEMTLDRDTLSTLRTAALLHDIGRAGIATDIWLHPGPLSDAEWLQVRTRPANGADILRAAAMPHAVEEIVRAHQERWDGDGYPARLRGQHIPLGARILAVAFAYDAMTSDRPWRKAIGHGEALERIRSEAGAAFDPTVVSAFERAARRGEFLDVSMPFQIEDGPANPMRVAEPVGADERI